MRAWIVFIVLGIVVGAVPTLFRRRSKELSRDLISALAGSVLGGYVVVKHVEPSLARILGPISAMLAAALFLWCSQPGRLQEVRSRTVQWLASIRLPIWMLRPHRPRLLAWLAITG